MLHGEHILIQNKMSVKTIDSFNYLGLPMLTGCLKKVDFDFIRDRVRKKMNG